MCAFSLSQIIWSSTRLNMWNTLNMFCDAQFVLELLLIAINNKLVWLTYRSMFWKSQVISWYSICIIRFEIPFPDFIDEINWLWISNINNWFYVINSYNLLSLWVVFLYFLRFLVKKLSIFIAFSKTLRIINKSFTLPHIPYTTVCLIVQNFTE